MLDFQQYVAQTKENINEISIDTFLKQNDSFNIIVDIREEKETTIGIIPNAIWIPRGILESNLNSLLPQDCEEPLTEWLPKQKILLYCRSGARSALAAASLAKMGVHDVYSLQSGIAGWIEKELPVTSLPN